MPVQYQKFSTGSYRTDNTVKLNVVTQPYMSLEDLKLQNCSEHKRKLKWILSPGQMIFPDKVCVVLSAAIHLLHASIAHPGNTCYIIIMSLKICLLVPTKPVIFMSSSFLRAPAGDWGHGFCL
jgi:hypothetical protein